MSSSASISAPPRAKAVIRADLRGATARYVEQLTPWHTRDHGRTEIEPGRLLAVAVDLIGRAAQVAESAWGPGRVRGIGVTGLAESGVLSTRPAERTSR